jgi:hypothetical protein
MKKVILYAFIFLLTANFNAFAQKDVAAKKILSGVSAKYHTYNIVKSDFTIVIDDSQAKTTEPLWRRPCREKHDSAGNNQRRQKPMDIPCQRQGSTAKQR